MSIRALRIAVFLFFIVYALAVTWPGALPFSGPTPFVLGLPFSMAWAVLWIVMGGLALWILHLAEERELGRGDESDRRDP
jgi:hypothetical protein